MSIKVIMCQSLLPKLGIRSQNPERRHSPVDGAKDWPACRGRKGGADSDDSDEKSLERGGALTYFQGGAERGKTVCQVLFFTSFKTVRQFDTILSCREF